MSKIPDEKPSEYDIDTQGVASTSECTGFIPAVTQNQEQVKSYVEITAPLSDENDFSVRKHIEKDYDPVG